MQTLPLGWAVQLLSQQICARKRKVSPLCADAEMVHNRADSPLWGVPAVVLRRSGTAIHAVDKGAGVAMGHEIGDGAACGVHDLD